MPGMATQSLISNLRMSDGVVGYPLLLFQFCNPRMEKIRNTGVPTLIGYVNPPCFVTGMCKGTFKIGGRSDTVTPSALRILTEGCTVILCSSRLSTATTIPGIDVYISEIW